MMVTISGEKKIWNSGLIWKILVYGSISHGGPIELFLIPASAPHCNKGCGMSYPVCNLVHIKNTSCY